MNNDKAYKKYFTSFFGKFHSTEQIHKEYKAHHKYFRANYLKFLPKNRDARILDIGCGMGHFLYFLKEEGYHNSLGIDISDEMVDICRKSSFDVLKADLNHFLKDEGNGEFDVIVMNDVLEHQKKNDIIPILTLCHQRLSDSGVLIIKVPNAASPIMGSSTRYHDFTHEVSFTEPSLFQVFRLGGFESVRVIPQNLYVFYYNPLNYLAMVFTKILYGIYKILFLLHGNTSINIFTKNLIAIGKK